MSYARTYSAMGRTHRNVCHSIRISERYKGYSLLAGEQLLDLVKAMGPARKSARQPADYSKLLDDLYPADHWYLKHECGARWETCKQKKSLYILQKILNVKRKFYLTFDGKRFLCSSLVVAIAYLRGVIPFDAWDYQPSKVSACKLLAQNGGRAVFTYGENEAIIERIIDNEMR